MAGVLDSVNQLTELVGQNRLELLLFRLPGREQLYGINVFKVKEVLECPHLTAMPRLNKNVRGVAHVRGQTISIIDMGLAIGGKMNHDLEHSYVIITEYNRSVQGFLVGGVDRIVNLDWSSIMPPKVVGKTNYLTAVTQVDKQLVEILDVEKILDEIAPNDKNVSETVVEEFRKEEAEIESKMPDRPRIIRKVMVADDSSVARNQVKRALKSINLESIVVENGQQALDKLRELAKNGPIQEQIGLLISDIEMPEMDGYTLTANIRQDPKLAVLKVILHTSLSGVFNQAMVKKVGADNFIAKFNPDELAKAVRKLMDEGEEELFQAIRNN
ncbi:chemotaxis protein CheV [Succinimonas amylolytica]|uniref:chemotaxis protein CheV n=1 Tax=Succinimonas amylolytica TaxID=83769 RepID=UPI0003745F48|nr:chemotaxis protein CheV [Succinimonas amylolytica]